MWRSQEQDAKQAAGTQSQVADLQAQLQAMEGVGALVERLCGVLHVGKDTQEPVGKRLGHAVARVEESEQQNMRLMEKLAQLEAWRAERVAGEGESEEIAARLNQAQNQV